MKKTVDGNRLQTILRFRHQEILNLQTVCKNQLQTK